jgi:hypothetical protein
MSELSRLRDSVMDINIIDTKSQIFVKLDMNIMSMVAYIMELAEW